MTQDVVTARDAAAPAVVTARLPDAQVICEKLNEALGERAIYSSSVQSSFQQAWVVAAHKRSRQVTIHHLAYGLVFDQPEAGKKLTEHLDSDVDSFAVGCILQVLHLGVSTGDADIHPPSVGTVRWLKQAVTFARQRGQRSELLPDDFVRAVLDDALPPSERDALRKAARVGNARRDAVIGPRPVPSIADVPVSSRDIIKHMEEVAKGYSPNQETDATELRTVLEEFEGQVMSKLEAIDQRIVAVGDALRRAPSGARVTAAIAAVLILGIAVGLALRFPSLGGSLLAQIFPVSAQ